MVERYLSMHKALGSVLSSGGEKKGKERKEKELNTGVENVKKFKTDLQ